MFGGLWVTRCSRFINSIIVGAGTKWSWGTTWLRPAAAGRREIIEIVSSSAAATLKMSSGDGARNGELNDKKPNIVFVLGAPGAGKGTQCDLIVKKFGYVHLSAGDLLRTERQNPDSKDGELIETCIREGKIVPVQITCKLLEKAMNASKSTSFLIDGFPRNKDNNDGWAEQMSDKVHLQFVLFLECDRGKCVSRCLTRGASGSGRSDDNEKSLEKRFDTYTNATKPIIDYYEERGYVRKVDASNTPEEVFAAVEKLFLSANS